MKARFCPANLEPSTPTSVCNRSLVYGVAKCVHIGSFSLTKLFSRALPLLLGQCTALRLGRRFGNRWHDFGRRTGRLHVFRVVVGVFILKMRHMLSSWRTECCNKLMQSGDSSCPKFGSGCCPNFCSVLLKVKSEHNVVCRTGKNLNNANAYLSRLNFKLQSKT